MENSIWEKFTSHGEILKKIWKHLDLGVIDRDHPFHQVVFATVSNNKPAVRTVILRRFWRKNPRGLAFHAHFGSPKIAEIEANPNGGSFIIRKNDSKSASKSLRLFTKQTI